MRPRKAPICPLCFVRTGWDRVDEAVRAAVGDWKFEASPTVNIEATDSIISRTVPAINNRGSEFSFCGFNLFLQPGSKR